MGPLNESTEPDPPRRGPPLQFGLSALLGLTVVVAVIFGVLRWLGVSPGAAALVLIVLTIAVAAAAALVVSITLAADGDDENTED